ncbi:uncharacterized protein LOC144108679 [Amblyomma americanum]
MTMSLFFCSLVNAVCSAGVIFLEKLIPADFFDVLLHANSEGAKNQELKHMAQNAKFKQLLASPPEAGVTASICNLSSHTLDPHERSLLLRGLNFNTGAPPNAVNMTCAVEEAIRKVAPSLQSEARSRAIGALSKLARSKTRTITPAEQTALTRLQKNKDIVILPADKGNATVVFDRTDYVRKMYALLEDTTTYAKLARDPTKKIESELQKLLSDVFKFVPPDKGYLYNRLLCHNGSAPAIYGVPKIHKKEVPLRLIVDFTRSPLNKLSGYLHRILAPLAGNTPTHVKDSAHFIDKLKTATFGDDHIMVSFDVRSMFTCVPVDFAVECCRNALKNDLSLPEQK